MIESAKIAVKHLFFRPGLRPYRIRGGALAGLSFQFDLHHDTQAWRGIYEKPLQNWLSRCVKTGDTCLDIGGADGYFALLMAKLSGSQGIVHTFEPSEKIEHIQQNFDLNKSLPLATLIQYNSFVGAENNVGNNTVSIDDLVEADRIHDVHVIKIDVDGGECDALRGMEQTLEKFHPYLFVETHSHELHKEVDEITKRHGYTMHLEMPAPYEVRPGVDYNAFYYTDLSQLKKAL